MDNNEMPMGFGMALAMNQRAIEEFAVLPENVKQEINNGTHSVASKAEMREYVEKIISSY